MIDEFTTFVVKQPEEMNRAFAAAYNAGNLDSLLSLYEPDAHLATPDNTIIVGMSAIRDSLLNLLKLGGQMISENQYAITSDNISLICASWTISTTDSNGEKKEVQGKSAEIVRRQPDQSWKYLIDHPFGAG